MSGVKQQMTPEELWEMPGIPGKQSELVNGELVEVFPAGVVHNLIAELIYRLLHAHADEHWPGLMFTDNLGYILS